MLCQTKDASDEPQVLPGGGGVTTLANHSWGWDSGPCGRGQGLHICQPESEHHTLPVGGIVTMTAILRRGGTWALLARNWFTTLAGEVRPRTQALPRGGRVTMWASWSQRRDPGTSWRGSGLPVQPARAGGRNHSPPSKGWSPRTDGSKAGTPNPPGNGAGSPGQPAQAEGKTPGFLGRRQCCRTS